MNFSNSSEDVMSDIDLDETISISSSDEEETSFICTTTKPNSLIGMPIEQQVTNSAYIPTPNLPIPCFPLPVPQPILSAPLPDPFTYNAFNFSPKAEHLISSTPTESRTFDMPTPDFSFKKSNRFGPRVAKKRVSEPETPRKAKTPRRRFLSHDSSNTSKLHSPENYTRSKTVIPSITDEQSNHFYQDTFECLEFIGEGSFSKVYKCRSNRDGKIYAIKELKREVNNRSRKMIIKELKYVNEFDHPNLIKYIFGWESVAGNKGYIQMEYCEGTLSDFIQTWHTTNPGKYIEENIIWMFATDTILGVDQLHTAGLVHRDISPTNILIDSNTNPNLKIGDFGMMCTESEGSCEDEQGDSRYSAPELSIRGFSKSSDIFSLGITLLELSCLINLPTGEEDDYEKFRSGNIANSEYFPTEQGKSLYSNELKQMIEDMMNPNETKRPTAQELLNYSKISELAKGRRISDKLNPPLDNLPSTVPIPFHPSKGETTNLDQPLLPCVSAPPKKSPGPKRRLFF